MAGLSGLQPYSMELESQEKHVAGAENRNRTYDLRVTSALLYRTELFRRVWGKASSVYRQQQVTALLAR